MAVMTVQYSTGQYSNGSNGKIKNPVCLLLPSDKLFIHNTFVNKTTFGKKELCTKFVTANSVHQFN